MALNDSAFKTAIVSLQDELIAAENYETAKTVFAEKLMQAVKAYILSGTVTVNVTTIGSATAQAGSGTGTIA